MQTFEYSLLQKRVMQKALPVEGNFIQTIK